MHFKKVYLVNLIFSVFVSSAFCNTELKLPDQPQVLIDQAYADIFTTNLGTAICQYVFFAGKAPLDVTTKKLIHMLGIGADSAETIAAKCASASLNESILPLEVSFARPQDASEKNSERVFLRPSREYVFVIDKEDTRIFDSFTDWDEKDRTKNTTYLIFPSNDAKNFYPQLLVRLAHEMAVTLDTKRNLGIRFHAANG